MHANPFEVVKSVDFSDEEINEYWVDLAESRDQFTEIIKPLSPTPMILLGGKGSGKTHVVRHYSYNLQRIRNKADIYKGVLSEGFLGVYFCLGGLNEGRFKGKGLERYQWTEIFVYHLDLSLAQQTLETFDRFLNDASLKDKVNEVSLCQSIASLFSPPITTPNSINEFITYLESKRREIDNAVNNCAFTNKLNVEILTNRGALVLKIPEMLVKVIPEGKHLKLLYLFDEIENVNIDVQIYLQTLIRECRKTASSIKLSGRLYGLKTRETYCDGEKNVEGSEYETLTLDEKLRDYNGYDDFIVRLCLRRLHEQNPHIKDKDTLYKCFTTTDVPTGSYDFSAQEERLGNHEAWFLLGKDLQKERRHLSKLKRKLESVDVSPDTVSKIMHNLSFHEYPFVEKTSTFILYKQWSELGKSSGALGDFLLVASNKIAASAKMYLEKDYKESLHFKKLGHFRNDLIAQLRREHDRKPQYLGMNAFIAMSCGLPRNLLQILKHTYAAALFRGEKVFSPSDPISVDAQRAGVRQAAQWFFEDALIGHDATHHLRDAILRLAETFAEVRFSDKPAECSVISFSTDESRLSPACRETIKVARERSLLIKVVGGRKDKNSRNIHVHYQLNPMLSPHWELPLHRRGTLPLDAGLVNSIFDPEQSGKFNSQKMIRLKDMYAPFKNIKGAGHQQLELGL